MSGVFGRHGPAPRTLVKLIVFAAVSGLLTWFIGTQITGPGYGGGHTLRAVFDDVGGLRAGDPVKVAGTPVGKVSGVRVDDGHAVVTMRIETKLKLPADSTAEVRWRNLIGQRMLYLVPGRVDGRWLRDGASITSTKAAVDLGQIVNELGPLTRNLDPNQLNQILQAVSRMLDGNGKNLSLLMVDLQALVKTFADRKDQIASITDDFAALSDIAAKRDGQIETIIDDLASISGAFADNTTLLGDATDQLSHVATTLDTVLSGNQAQLGRAIANIDSITDTAVQNTRKIEKAVTQLPPSLRSLFSITNGGHYARINVLCFNIVRGPCPWPLQLPGQSGAAASSNSGQNRQKLLDLLKSLSREAG